MKCRLQLYVDGLLFNEDVYAKDYSEAKEVALGIHPNATVISVGHVMEDFCLLYTSPSPRDS